MGALTVNAESDIFPIVRMETTENEARLLLSKWKEERQQLTCILWAPCLDMDTWSVKLFFTCAVHAITDDTVILRHVKHNEETPGVIEFVLPGANFSFSESPESELIESDLLIEFPHPPLDVPQLLPKPNFRALIFVPPSPQRSA
jgi:hypothetical protein